LHDALPILQIHGIHRQGDTKTAQKEEDAKLTENFAAVERLERVVKTSVPSIDTDTGADRSQIKCYNREEESPRRPFFFGCPIGFCDRPRVTHEASLSRDH